MTKKTNETTKIDYSETANEIIQGLSKENIEYLRQMFSIPESEIAVDSLIMSIVKILEGRYSYKVIHEDVSNETRDTYIAMCRVARQFPYIYAFIKKATKTDNKEDGK